MSLFSTLGRRRFVLPCTVEIERSQESLPAHVTIDADFRVEPGDEVLLHDAPTDVPYGARVVTRSTATVIRANAVKRAWTRWTGNFELTEFYDVSFTERRML